MEINTSTNKKCSICTIVKPINEFSKAKSNLDGYCGYCKPCRKEKYAYLYKSGKYDGRYKETERKNYLKNRQKKIDAARNWQKNNKKRFAESQKKYKNKPIERAKSNLRRRIKKLLAGEVSVDCSIGCSKKELAAHLESKFQEGMTWENYGLRKERFWVIDHIKPLASFDLTDKSQRLQANNYTNLQPLWSLHNEAKSDNYDPDHTMGWAGLDALMGNG